MAIGILKSGDLETFRIRQQAYNPRFSADAKDIRRSYFHCIELVFGMLFVGWFIENDWDDSSLGEIVEVLPLQWETRE
jgi:hypothetical protein